MTLSNDNALIQLAPDQSISAAVRNDAVERDTLIKAIQLVQWSVTH